MGSGKGDLLLLVPPLAQQATPRLAHFSGDILDVCTDIDSKYTCGWPGSLPGARLRHGTTGSCSDQSKTLHRYPSKTCALDDCTCTRVSSNSDDTTAGFRGQYADHVPIAGVLTRHACGGAQLPRTESSSAIFISTTRRKALFTARLQYRNVSTRCMPRSQQHNCVCL